MTTVTVNLIGPVAPGLPRQMIVSLGEEATLRTLIDEVGRRGGEALRRSICAEGDRMADSLLIALDGEVVDPDRLDAPLEPSGTAAEVSLFLIRPIFGGAVAPPLTDAHPPRPAHDRPQISREEIEERAWCHNAHALMLRQGK